jgi:hypothetical protein
MESTLEITPGMLCCMNDEGDKRIMWDANDYNQVNEAEALFNEYKGRGYLAYKTNKQGQSGEVINKFDAKAERIIMRPQMIGG